MNRLQKQSWIMVASIGLAFFASCIVVAYWAASKGFPNAFHGLIFTFSGVLVGYFSGLLVKRDKPVIVDERYLSIKALAKNNGFIASYICLIINITILPMCVYLFGIIFPLVESLTYIIEYGKDNQHAKGGAI